MMVFRNLLIICALTIGSTGHAVPETPAPDPANLAADWWSYFEPEEKLSDEELRTRIDEFSTHIDTVSASTDAALQHEYGQLATDIGADLNHFYELQTTPQPPSTPATPAKTVYSLSEALARHSDLRAAKLKVETEQEETAWLSAVNNEERRQQSRQRSQYLEMKKGHPDKLLKGLELIYGRIHLEIRKVELETRKSALAQAREQEARLRVELKSIPAHLTISESELNEWQTRGEQAEAQIKSGRERGQRRKPSDSLTGDAALDFIKTQHTVLTGISYNVEIGLNESKIIQTSLISSLHGILNLNVAEHGETARKVLSDNEELHDRLVEQRARWQRVTQRIRNATPPTEDSKNITSADLLPLQKKTASLVDKTDQLLRMLDKQMESTQFIAQLLEERLHEQEGWFSRSLKDTEETFANSWSTTINLMGASLFEINETPVTTLGILRVILIITLALWLSKGIRRAIKRIGERKGAISESSLYTFGRLIHYVVLIIGIIIGLSSIGIDFTKFALFASALGVGIGFGLQTLISNFVAGLIILFEKSLKVGDFVELESGVTGEVKEINMRSTLITTNDNIDILVPNSEFVGGRVINWTLREVYRRTHIPFGVAYGTDKELVRKAVLEAADLIPCTLKNRKGRHPQVWFVEFGDSSLNFELVVWLNPDAVKRPGAVQSGYLWEIETKLKEYGIEIPFPQRDLHLRSVFGIKDEDAHELLPGGHVGPGHEGA